ncbi:ATP-binding protein [uncultured Hymenobacter sp.]|uniref:ATP-binding protein n=1 Tax=uncultured Hymenobacter sp. TaxID=170016 RepID=UPI0035CBDBC2
MAEPTGNGLPHLQALTQENEELRHQLQEAQELIEAVRTGAVDALAIQGADGPRIFTLEGADQGYRTLIERMNEGALLLSPDNTILYCNACLAGWLELGLETVIGSSFDAFVPPTFGAYWAGLLGQGWAGWSRGELPLGARGGTQRPVAVSMNVLIFNEAPVLAVILTDLSAETEVKAIRARVAEQNQLLEQQNEVLKMQEAARLVVEQAAAEARRLLEGIPQIAWTAGPDGRNTYLNSGWFDYVAPQGERSRDEWLRSAIHPDDLAAGAAAWRQCLATGQALEVECRIRNAAGHYRWMLGRALPSRDEQGAIMQWVGTYTDIHEHKLALARIDEAQRALQANNEQLTRANVDLDNFIYTASHDLKAPITNIEGLLDALRWELRAQPGGVGIAADAPPTEVAPILGMMQDSVERFKRTIEQLTDVTQLQKESAAPAAPLDLARLIAEVQLDLAPQVQASGAEVRVEVGSCPPVSFSEKNLRSVVYNLLSNALKYRAPARPPRVHIRCRHEGAHIVLEVQDNGLGLELRHGGEEKLFALFQRLHDHVEGSGIGLFMVKKMVENAGGHIRVQSELGVGSTFAVYLKQ